MTDEPGRTDALTALGGVPAPATFAVGPSRHAPDRDDLRTSVRELVGTRAWATLSWPALLEALMTVGRADIGRARLTEGHVDALRIAAQAGHPVKPGALYGVWASRSGGSGARGEPDGRPVDPGLRLSGGLVFASGAGIIDRALVPVGLGDGTTQLVDLDARGLPVDPSGWHTAAMTVSHTHAVAVGGVVVPRSDHVGRPGFYTDRPAFLPGGVGVAAVWVGGLARVVDVLLPHVRTRASPATDLRLGRIRTALAGAVATLRQSGLVLDQLLDPDGRLVVGADAEQLAALTVETRAVVTQAVDVALADVRVLAGPAGLALDAALGRAVDDLTLYALQQSRDGDAGLLGRGWRGT